MSNIESDSSCNVTYKIVDDEKVYARVFVNENFTLVWNQHKWQDGEYATYIQKMVVG